MSANYTACIFCAVVLCGHISELGAAINQRKIFCFPRFLISWRIHTTLIDTRGRGKATAAPLHLCPLLRGKRALVYGLQCVCGLFGRCAKVW